MSVVLAKRAEAADEIAARDKLARVCNAQPVNDLGSAGPEPKIALAHLSDLKTRTEPDLAALADFAARHETAWVILFSAGSITPTLDSADRLLEAWLEKRCWPLSRLETERVLALGFPLDERSASQVLPGLEYLLQNTESQSDLADIRRTFYALVSPLRIPENLLAFALCYDQSGNPIEGLPVTFDPGVLKAEYDRLAALARSRGKSADDWPDSTAQRMKAARALIDIVRSTD